MRSFASDNNSGVHPEVLQAMVEANEGHAIGYGDDRWTEKAKELIRNEFGEDTATFFCFSGTAANIFAVASVLRPYECVLTSSLGHIHRDENGAPERILSCKIVGIESADGKVTPDALSRYLSWRNSPHTASPRVVSITQATELGLLYTPIEVREISRFCRENELLLHMDGARISNAAVAQGLTLREATRDLGVDILCLGGTKNGLMGAEAVLFFGEGMQGWADRIQKQCLQLASKMRFLSAQMIAFMSNRLWERNAQHSNRTAALLAKELQEIKGVKITRPVEANIVFLSLPPEIISELKRSHFFYATPQGEARLVTSFDTTDEDVRAFTGAVEMLMRGQSLR